MHREIEIFYDQYVHRSYPDEQFFLGHFDVLHWEDLKRDLSACERLQRKPFYKIALLNGTAKYHSNNVEVPISGYTIVFTDPMTRSSFSRSEEHTSELQSRENLVCRLLLEKKNDYRHS